MIRSYSLFLLVSGVALALPEGLLASPPEGMVPTPLQELSPKLAAPFRLDVRGMIWDGDPHAAPYGRAVLEADGAVVWELQDVTRAAASADGSTVALLMRDHRVFVSRLPEPPRALDAHQYLSPRLSADGAQLVAQRLGPVGHILDQTLNARGIALVNLVTGEERLVLEGNDLYSPSFASDELLFFGSGGKDQIASLYILDLSRMRVARVTNRESGARQTFPSAPPSLAGGSIHYDADGERFEVATPARSDFGPVHRFESPRAVEVDFEVPPNFGPVRLRRPNTQVKKPKVYQYYDIDRQKGRIKDWACLGKTYDQHRATDFNQAYGFDVVAPASGLVVYRNDGCADTNSPGCGFGLGNHVALLHSDGTLSLVAHGKKWTVVDFGTYPCGTVLMQSADSGNSNAYHIHHEVWLNKLDAYRSNRFDPYEGSCDPNDDSKWGTQNPYGDLPGTTCTH